MGQILVRQCVAVTLCASITGACATYTETVKRGDPYPDNSRQKISYPETGEGNPKGTVSLVSPLAVQVNVEVPSLCRTTTETPEVVDVTTERKAANNSDAWHYVEGIVAGAGVIGGAYFIASPCSAKSSGGNGGQQSTTCTPSDEQQGRATGGVLIGIGVLASLPLVYGLVRGRDTVTTEPAKPKLDKPSWQDCGTKPADKAEVVLKLASGRQMTGETDKTGRVRFELGNFEEKEIFAVPKATVILPTVEGLPVDLSEFPEYAVWKKKEDAAGANQQRSDDAAREEEQRQSAEDRKRVNTKMIAGLGEQLRQLKPPWTPEKVKKYGEVLSARKSVVGSTVPTDEAKLRVIDTALERLRPTMIQLVAQLEAQQQQHAADRQAAAVSEVLEIGRAAVLDSILTPSTASFRDDTVLMRCPSGVVITQHVLDFQNGFGAMVRDTKCVSIDLQNHMVKTEAQWCSLAQSDASGFRAACDPRVFQLGGKRF